MDYETRFALNDKQTADNRNDIDKLFRCIFGKNGDTEKSIMGKISALEGEMKSNRTLNKILVGLTLALLGSMGAVISMLVNIAQALPK